MNTHVCQPPAVRAGLSWQCSGCATWWFTIARGKAKASAVVQWVSNGTRNPYPSLT